MARVAFALGLGLLVGGCCTTLRERMDAYARTAADNADTTSILVERCVPRKISVSPPRCSVMA